MNLLLFPERLQDLMLEHNLNATELAKKVRILKYQNAHTETEVCP